LLLWFLKNTDDPTPMAYHCTIERHTLAARLVMSFRLFQRSHCWPTSPLPHPFAHPFAVAHASESLLAMQELIVLLSGYQKILLWSLRSRSQMVSSQLDSFHLAASARAHHPFLGSNAGQV